MTPEIWVAAGGVSLICALLVLLNAYKAKTTQNEVQKAIEDAIKDSKKDIERAISPKVIFLSSIDQVRRETAGFISKASDQFKDASDKKAKEVKENESGASSIDLSKYFITIYGSASLGNESQVGEQPEDEARRESIRKYQAAMDKAKSVQIQFHRYISLMSQGGFGRRSGEIQREYVDWLQKQLRLINDDSNYTLILSPRAPQWGTSSTTFLAYQGIIEVKGHMGMRQ